MESTRGETKEYKKTERRGPVVEMEEMILCTLMWVGCNQPWAQARCPKQNLCGKDKFQTPNITTQVLDKPAGT